MSLRPGKVAAPDYYAARNRSPLPVYVANRELHKALRYHIRKDTRPEADMGDAGKIRRSIRVGKTLAEIFVRSAGPVHHTEVVCAVPFSYLRELACHFIKRLVPAYPLPLVFSPLTFSPERMEHAIRVIEELR